MSTFTSPRGPHTPGWLNLTGVHALAGQPVAGDNPMDQSSWGTVHPRRAQGPMVTTESHLVCTEEFQGSNPGWSTGVPPTASPGGGADNTSMGQGTDRHPPKVETQVRILVEVRRGATRCRDLVPNGDLVSRRRVEWAKCCRWHAASPRP